MHCYLKLSIYNDYCFKSFLTGVATNMSPRVHSWGRLPYNNNNK